ncbi:MULTISPECIES: phage portal protein [unclassified Neptuniibacter]|uniref:phage portal protein n=1 Tax=unclassified Neptuniibacter TaxID=2630693 RepID=UPI000C40A159|nr:MULTISPECIES: phage portal protein [unclassified Neptuniibacter]MAY42391.1 phage portal protein [Oceanospirillaceae bacterium]|tara:strand:- start:15726 stop:17246 length:1521 start_codon:yes stop_codon:yes gene_type:complete
MNKQPSVAQRLINWAWHRYVGPSEKTGMARAFEAAKSDRLRLGWSGRASSQSADQDIYRDLGALVQYAREQSVNQPYAKRYYTLLKNNVIGPRGMKFQSRVKLPDGKPDRLRNKTIEESWKRFCKKGSFDVTGRYHHVTFKQLWIETLARDGEVLVREHFGHDNEWGYSVQILECDRLDLNYNTDLKNGNRIRMSVELDQWEKPVAYHLLVNHPGDSTYSWQGNEYERVPAEEIIHTFIPWRPHQTRGIPWTHAGMVELYHIGEYRKAELTSAEETAKSGGFFEQDPEAFEDAPKNDQGEIVHEVEAGSYHLLPYGVRFNDRKADRAGANFGAFLKDAVRGVSSAWGVSYNRLANDLEGVNFSSLRSGELDERDMYKVLQFFVIEELEERINRNWMRMSLLTQALPFSMLEFDHICQPSFQPRGWGWVDPKNDSKAHTEDINNRTRTRSSFIREAGEDPEEVFDEFEWEEQLLQGRGLLNETEQNSESEGDEQESEDEQPSGSEGD